MTMLYETYQAQEDLLAPWRSLVVAGGEVLRKLPASLLDWPLPQTALAAAEIVPLTALGHTRQPFGIDSVQVGGRPVAVSEEAVTGSRFGTLLRFAKTPHIDQPRVLLLAPLSGHFATLLRDTVRTMLPDHDVFITDWHNCRDVPLAEGAFGLDEHVQHVIDFSARSVRRPSRRNLPAGRPSARRDRGDGRERRSVPAVQSDVDGGSDRRPSEPHRRQRPRQPAPIDWFERNLIARVPGRYPGAGRRVYPGFLQLTAFMAMNPGRHAGAFANLFADLVAQNHAQAAKTEEFYREYFAVLDLAAEFYLETVEQVFQEHRLARGELYW